ncbi:MAG: flagellar basal body L-ring protein FlgH [Negativicutes bacterium]|nr:flagellar basal body L-ring protein FlgH [Negativicutes bacterium]
MEKKFRMGLSLLLGIMLLLVMTNAEASSLWSDNTPAANLYGDRKARAVGDVLTIIINEASSSSREGKAENSKAASSNVTAGVGLFTFINNASFGADDQFNAQGKISNTNKVSGTISVTVTAIQPNGNLLVAGTQSIKQNGEEHKITITGTVRPDDIKPDNTVLSNYVANATLRIDGKGPIASKQRQGILSQLLNIIF